ncbi:proline dehydrogenase [Amycolatopsis acidicola]|uniref:proline dehydrogenase n=1 Tax=Amycolatopsis acidicola TaxID=2596893 RepID=A0A5N0VEV4_9PSEU|nr:proline dehydrogenase family protein [Amycolatopsis acidicola]KAA9164877.1 proline dehydrogenase [Amycolatopsis acidicola]
MNPFRSLLLAAAGNDSLRRAVATAPATRGLAERFVAGETVADAVTAVGELVDDGRYATLEHLGEDVREPGQAERTVQTYLALLDRLYDEGLAARAEVSVKLSALGLGLDEKLAMDNAWRICAAAEQCATTVTIDMEDHRTTDATLRAVEELRHTWPWVGVALQSSLNRTEKDAAALAVADSRVRLCKGGYTEPREVAWRTRHEADLSYVRAANTLLAGAGYPMFATHDPRLIDILGERIRWHGRKPGSYEFQMCYGVRPAAQAALAAAGETVRVSVPFGEHSYGGLVRRLAERPANLVSSLRALVDRS